MLMKVLGMLHASLYNRRIKSHVKKLDNFMEYLDSLPEDIRDIDDKAWGSYSDVLKSSALGAVGKLRTHIYLMSVD